MEELEKYVPVFQAVIGGLTTMHFNAYFIAMFKELKIPTNEDGDPCMCGIMMDFSQAQRAGLFQAFASSFPFSKIKPEVYLKGCYYHWKNSVERILKNGQLISTDQVNSFLEYTKTMYEANVPGIFDAVVKGLLKDFPSIQEWVSWWLKPEISSMIFRSKSLMRDQLLWNTTKTTNGVEAFHRNIYRLIQKDKPILTTLPQLFNYLRTEEHNIQHVLSGKNINYKKASST